jgi:hypothetical protein
MAVARDKRGVAWYAATAAGQAGAVPPRCGGSLYLCREDANPLALHRGRVLSVRYTPSSASSRPDRTALTNSWKSSSF